MVFTFAQLAEFDAGIKYLLSRFVFKRCNEIYLYRTFMSVGEVAIRLLSSDLFQTKGNGKSPYRYIF